MTASNRFRECQWNFKGCYLALQRQLKNLGLLQALHESAGWALLS